MSAQVRGDAETETTGDTTPEILIGGLIGGVVGAVAFGAVMWTLNPDFLRTSIPALYGLEPRGVLGWAVHLAHGAILGLLFGAIVSRPFVTDALLPEHDDEELGPTGPATRLTIAGLAYGLAIWALLPMIVMPVWLGAVGGDEVEAIPAAAVESLLGHAAFGIVLGAVYAAIVTRT